MAWREKASTRPTMLGERGGNLNRVNVEEGKGGGMDKVCIPDLKFPLMMRRAWDKFCWFWASAGSGEIATVSLQRKTPPPPSRYPAQAVGSTHQAASSPSARPGWARPREGRGRVERGGKTQRQRQRQREAGVFAASPIALVEHTQPEVKSPTCEECASWLSLASSSHVDSTCW